MAYMVDVLQYTSLPRHTPSARHRERRTSSSDIVDLISTLNPHQLKTESNTARDIETIKAHLAGTLQSIRYIQKSMMEESMGTNKAIIEIYRGGDRLHDKIISLVANELGVSSDHDCGDMENFVDWTTGQMVYRLLMEPLLRSKEIVSKNGIIWRPVITRLFPLVKEKIDVTAQPITSIMYVKYTNHSNRVPLEGFCIP